MKRMFFILAVFVMAFGNVSFAQRKANLKNNFRTNKNEIVLKHYGLRNDDVKPAQAICQTTNVDEMFRYTYTYDEYEYYLMETLLEMDFGYGWCPMEMITYEYDFSGNVLEMIDMEYDDGYWMEVAKASYSYNDSGMEVVYQYYDDGIWNNDYKEVYNYNGDVTTILIWEWNGSNWSSSELITYTYSDTTIDVLVQYMEGGAWQNDDKQTITLDFAGHVTEILYEDWENMAWVNEEKVTYDYEGNLYYTMNKEEWENGSWKEEYRFSFLYDDGNATHGECMVMQNGQWVHGDDDIEMAYNYSAVVNEYYGSVVDVTYIDVTGVEESTQVGFNVYPMPAEDEIRIQVENFQKAEIYSVTGQKLIESQQNNMNVGVLSSGVYLLKVYDQTGKVETQRVVVK